MEWMIFFIRVRLEGVESFIQLRITSVKDFQLQELPLPSALPIESAFKNNFQATMMIPGIK